MRHIFAPGTPKPKGSLRFLGKGRVIEQVAGSSAWRDTVAIAAAQRRDMFAWDTWADQPIGAALEFIVPKPKSVRREWPHARSSGDVDKLARNALDALVDAHIIGDDSQVVELHATKAYPTPERPAPGLHISLWRITGNGTEAVG